MTTRQQQLTQEEKVLFKNLVLPLIDDLHRVAVGLCRNNTDAEELVAESVARACEHFRTLRDQSKVKQWLLRILSNTFISHCRSRKQKNEIPLNVHDDDNEHFSLFDQLSMPFLLWWGNPEREVINKLLDEDIQKAIRSLPEDFRIVIMLCDVEGLSYQEIAHALQIPIGTVRSRIARGRSILQRHLWQYALEAGIIHHKSYRRSNKRVEAETTP